jgi:hypothetical protein
MPRPLSTASAAAGSRRARRLRLRQLLRPAARSLSAAPTHRASSRCDRPQALEVSRAEAHLRLPARRRRDRLGERQVSDGAPAHHDHRALPPPPAGWRACRSLHARPLGIHYPADNRRVTRPELPRTISDPDGRVIEFSERSWLHIRASRPELLADLRLILAATQRVDHHEHDRIVGRERFYLRHVTESVRWMTVVVDFNVEPAIVVTAFIQHKNPVRER